MKRIVILSGAKDLAAVSLALGKKILRCAQDDKKDFAQ